MHSILCILISEIVWQQTPYSGEYYLDTIKKNTCHGNLWRELFPGHHHKFEANQAA
ncbi:hypothetical protein [Candidatus Kuenenia stuttgartiensis]|uniref:hypothetical protein n=1 Tax=Kuenenia stuttgartiensis TaxID=174633 RepID=UPI00146E5DFC|nr:hypothetical protein [Candidatus Kuenenia stuttgartiensis]